MKFNSNHFNFNIMEDYSLGKIYKITSNHCELPYIGSTTDTLEYRLDAHRRRYRKWINNGKLRTAGQYCSSAEILKYDDAKIELIENYPCNSKKELREYEGTFQEIGVNCVNLKKAGRKWSDWHKNVYYKKNKERILRLQKAPHIKKYRSEKIPCECGSIITRMHLKRHIETAKKHKNWVLKNKK